MIPDPVRDAARHALHQAVTELYPQEERWFRLLWESVWRRVDQEDAGLEAPDQGGLSTAIASEIGFAAPGTTSGFDSLPLVGVVISFTVDLSTQGGRALSPGEARSRIQTFMQAWQAPQTLDDVIAKICVAVQQAVKDTADWHSKPYLVEVKGDLEQPKTKMELTQLRGDCHPADFGVWLDLTLPEIWVGGEQVVGPGQKLPHPSLRALRRLVLDAPHEVTHLEFYEEVYGPVGAGDQAATANSARINTQKWLSDLWRRANGLRQHIETMRGGYRWRGPKRYCVIRRRAGD
jgi:hypothetical protein